MMIRLAIQLTIRITMMFTILSAFHMMASATVNDLPENEVTDAIKLFFNIDPFAFSTGVLVLAMVTAAVVANFSDDDKNPPAPSTPNSAAAKKHAPAVGICQDCGCELLDTDATFCEDCQLAFFVADDEVVTLAQVVGDE